MKEKEEEVKTEEKREGESDQSATVVPSWSPRTFLLKAGHALLGNHYSPCPFPGYNSDSLWV